jgi:hypothetical protein
MQILRNYFVASKNFDHLVYHLICLNPIYFVIECILTSVLLLCQGGTKLFHHSEPVPIKPRF